MSATATGIVTLETALRFDAAGINVLPPKEDGTKAPLGLWGGQWKPGQTKRTTALLARLFPRNGIGAVCGAISGSLEVLDFDRRSYYDAFVNAAQAVGLGGLVQRLLAGYWEETPNGAHLPYRCAEIEGNQKLARIAEPDTGEIKAIIESRGEGGFIIMAPSGGAVHESGSPYVGHGDVENIITITPEERRELWALARTFDEMPVKESTDVRPSHGEENGDRPGDVFNRTSDWKFLQDAGWVKVYRQGDRTYWRRPGKNIGISAMTGMMKGDARHELLYAFTTSTALDSERWYTPFNAYATLCHGGDFAAAASDLARTFGSKSVKATIAPGWMSPTSSSPAPSSDWPEQPGEDAFYGLAGRIVAALAPHTEADPVALLASFLSAFGVAVGDSPHFMVGATRHPARDFFALVGKSAKARKGDSHAAIALPFSTLPNQFAQSSGLSTGEGLIHAVRDRITKEVTDKRTGESREEVVDEGVQDKRLHVVEPELARVLAVLKRQGNTLSAVIRDAWDCRDLHAMTKSPVTATSPHIALLGHITLDELKRELDDTTAANGFANRFIWLAVRRWQELPRPKALHPEDIADLIAELSNAVETARYIGEMDFDSEADKAWRGLYSELSAERGGLLGSIVARSEAHVLRLSMIFALTDGSALVRLPHLAAALELWEYAERSAAYVFGNASGDPIADVIAAELRSQGPLTRTEINKLFGGHEKSTAIDLALVRLTEAGKVERVLEDTGGRPREIWRVTQ